MLGPPSPVSSPPGGDSGGDPSSAAVPPLPASSPSRRRRSRAPEVRVPAGKAAAGPSPGSLASPGRRRRAWRRRPGAAGLPPWCPDPAMPGLDQRGGALGFSFCLRSPTRRRQNWRRRRRPASGLAAAGAADPVSRRPDPAPPELVFVVQRFTSRSSRCSSTGGAGPAGRRRADPAPSRPDLACAGA